MLQCILFSWTAADLRDVPPLFHQGICKLLNTSREIHGYTRMVCHCKDDQLCLLSRCSTVLGVLQYGHYKFIALATSAILIPNYLLEKK